MMQRAGLLSEGQVADAHEHAAVKKLPFVNAILELGLSDEDAIVAFFHSKLMIPRVSPNIFERLDAETTARIPGDLAWKHRCVPVSADDFGNLTVAMADPTDMLAVDAVTHHSRAYLVRAVAPVSAMGRALRRYYAAPPGAGTGGGGAPAGPPPIGGNGHGDDGDSNRGRARPPPSLLGPETEQTPLSTEAFAGVIPHLVEAKDRDEIVRVLLDFLGAGFSRVLLFVHVHGELRGRDARGTDLILDAVKQVRIPADGPSVFRKVIDGKKPHFGPLRSDTEINAAFCQAMGGVSGNVLVLPVVLRKKVRLVVFAMGLQHPVDPRSIQRLADGVSGAVERLIMRKKAGN